MLWNRKTEKFIEKTQKKGEIVLTGLGILRNYLGAGELYPKKVKQGEDGTLYYYTGDYGSSDKNGNIKFLGRIDRQVKKYGRLIAIEEIEKCLNEYQEVATSIVTVTRPGKQIIAAIGLNEEFAENALKKLIFELRNYCGEKLPLHMCPARWHVYINSSTNSDEVSSWKKKKLNTKEKPNGIFLANRPVDVVDKGDLCKEKVEDYIDEIKKLWEKILLNKQELQVLEIGKEDDFFFVGGDSLLYKILVTRFETKFKIKFPREAFAYCSTISFLARYLCKEKSDFQINSLNETADSEHQVLPLFCIHSLLGDCVNDYGELAIAFPERALYGISDRNLHETLFHYESIYEIANDYYQLIIKEHKLEHYLFLGWSFGGVVAKTMAEICRKDGRAATAILLDSTAPDFLQQGITAEEHSEYILSLAELTWRYLTQEYGSDFIKDQFDPSHLSIRKQIKSIFSLLRKKGAMQ